MKMRMLRQLLTIMLGVTFVFCSTFSFAQEAGGEVTALKAALGQAKAKFSSLNTYTSVISFQERHKGKLLGKEIVECHFKKPNSIYLKWLPGSLYENLQVSYLPSRDGNSHFMGLAPGIKGVLGPESFSFTSKIIDSLYPHHFRPHETNIGHLLNLMNQKVDKASKSGKLAGVTVSDKSIPALGKTIKVYDVKLSDNPSDGLMFSRFAVGFDSNTKLPIYVELYDFNKSLKAKYAFTKLKLNVPVPSELFTLKKL